LTADGCYSAKSTYKPQFIGSFSTFDNKAVWSAKVEDKHRFFGWLLVQCKLLTADRLSERNWPCNPVCQHLETAESHDPHVCLRSGGLVVGGAMDGEASEVAGV
jgi:hypothetical protein